MNELTDAASILCQQLPDGDLSGLVEKATDRMAETRARHPSTRGMKHPRAQLWNAHGTVSGVC
jgi:hypothetical protein